MMYNSIRDKLPLAPAGGELVSWLIRVFYI